MPISLPRVIAFVMPVIFCTQAISGLPRGARITADQQTVDDKTGATLAKGRAEISVDQQKIEGSAEAIEVRPAIDEILLKGRAKISVGETVYEGETVSCTLDFQRCIRVDQDQPLPASALPASEFEAATISPR